MVKFGNHDDNLQLPFETYIYTMWPSHFGYGIREVIHFLQSQVQEHI